MEFTKNQKAIMTHTIISNDNWFGTGLSCQDSNDFEILIKAGYAISEKPPSWMGDDVIYRLTDRGKQAVQSGFGV